MIQDVGRIGFIEVGVSNSGAWDHTGYQLATGLVGQDNAPCFEILLGKFEITCNHRILFAVVGHARVEISDNKAASATAMYLNPGETLSLTPDGTGPVYLAVAGLMISKTLSSASTDTLSGLGPKPVQSGDTFEVDAQTGSDELVGSFLQPRPKQGPTFHYIPGPNQLEISGNYEVRTVSRTGIRLSNASSTGHGILASFPVLPGSIQLTPSGKPVILGPDAGTTGGYPVAGVIIRAEQDYLSHLIPGSQIRLEPITPQQAKTKLQLLEKYLTHAVIRPSNMGAW
ncbi:MAG: hypothetical protein EBR26_05670 [Microbacteriaceae bacterium]|nr:hypothetical protein [Microbacteriaceae bacterium]